MAKADNIDTMKLFANNRKHWFSKALRTYGYDVHYAFHEGNFSNMAVYGLVGAFLLEKLGLCNSSAQFDRVMPWLLSRLDENGMFDDHDDAMLYDLSARVQLEQLLWLGYHGKYEAVLTDKLAHAAEFSLRMQSAAYHIPYGGRSNQYLHNEALFVSLGELEAARATREGDALRTGRFKRAAHLSAKTFSRYLNSPNGVKHIMNLFETDSLFGIDDYGTFPRYMNCLAIFLHYGYLCVTRPNGIFAPPAKEVMIQEVPAPCETGGFVVCTSDRFYKVFSACSGYSIEIATDADPHYDAPGLGRIHKMGIPAELGLSIPFTATPKYYLSRKRIPLSDIGPLPISVYKARHPDAALDIERLCLPASNFAIYTGWTGHDGVPRFLCEYAGRLHTELSVLCESHDETRFMIRWTGMEEVLAVDEVYTVTSTGVTVLGEVQGSTEAWSCVPILVDNGWEKTELAVESDRIIVKLGRYRYAVSSDGDICVTTQMIANRSGIYKRALFRGNNSRITITLALEDSLSI